MKTLKVQFVPVLLVSFFFALRSYGQITPSGDAYTDSATPTTNYGAKTVLDVDGASQITYIRFDLSSIPAGASVSQATLKLYVNSVLSAGSFNVDYINGSWTEGTIDYSNAPAVGGNIASNVPVTTANKNDYILINVTPALAAWLDGSQANDGIALVANSTFNATFDSKENTTTSHPPELDIVYAAIGGVTTASGSGLMGGGTSGTLSLSLTNTCAANQVLQWNGSAWGCAAAGTGTITGVTAGPGLTGGGSSGNVTLNLDMSKVPQLSGGNNFSGNQSVTGNFAATGLVSGATGSFSGSNSTQILNVAQNGTGWGILSSNVAPNMAAIYGTSSNASGVGVEGFNTASTGGIAMSAATNSTSGIALFAAAGASTGTSLGIQAQSNSPNGTAIFAVNTAGGLAGSFAGSVKVGGNATVSGNVSSTGQLISTVATGTAPLSVSSTTQVANLNASLLGGQPASNFATTGANSFSGNEAVSGNLSATGVVSAGAATVGSPLPAVIGNPVCGGNFGAIGFGAGALTDCTHYSLLGEGVHTYLNRPTGGQMLFREGNNTEMVLASGGNLGIGTTTPNYLLHVNGTMRAETGLSMGGNAVLSVDAVNKPGGRLQVNNSGVSIGGDTPMNSAPHMSFGGAFFGSLCQGQTVCGGGTGSGWGAFVPDRNIVITRITATINDSIDPSCLPGSVGVYQKGGAPLVTAPLPADSYFLDSQIIPPVAISAGTQLGFNAVLNTPANCNVGASAGGNLWINVQYVMQ